MACGILCIMRRERRGVLHLDKYSPPRAICSGGGGGGGGGGEEEKEKGKRKRKKEERQRKGKRTSSSLINKQRSCSNERICTSRGRGSLILWLVFV